MIDTKGKHILAEYYGCHIDVINSVDHITSIMIAAAEVAGATIVSKSFHRFAPQGVSGVIVLKESHLSIHTWPEKAYAAVDFYTCGDCQPEKASKLLTQLLGATKSELMVVLRGLGDEPKSMKIINGNNQEFILGL